MHFPNVCLLLCLRACVYSRTVWPCLQSAPKSRSEAVINLATRGDSNTARNSRHDDDDHIVELLQSICRLFLFAYHFVSICCRSRRRYRKENNNECSSPNCFAADHHHRFCHRRFAHSYIKRASNPRRLLLLLVLDLGDDLAAACGGSLGF